VIEMEYGCFRFDPETDGLRPVAQIVSRGYRF